MKQIREKEDERQRWATPLTGRELQQFESNLSHMTMLARFHNSAAVDTTHTLALLTSSCSQLFCHSIMVDRICAMLNYFLLKLVRNLEFAFISFFLITLIINLIINSIGQEMFGISWKKFLSSIIAIIKGFVRVRSHAHISLKYIMLCVFIYYTGILVCFLVHPCWFNFSSVNARFDLLYQFYDLTTTLVLDKVTCYVLDRPTDGGV